MYLQKHDLYAKWSIPVLCAHLIKILLVRQKSYCFVIGIVTMFGFFSFFLFLLSLAFGALFFYFLRFHILQLLNYSCTLKVISIMPFAYIYLKWDCISLYNVFSIPSINLDLNMNDFSDKNVRIHENFFWNGLDH